MWEGVQVIIRVYYGSGTPSPIPVSASNIQQRQRVVKSKLLRSRRWKKYRTREASRRDNLPTWPCFTLHILTPTRRQGLSSTVYFTLYARLLSTHPRYREATAIHHHLNSPHPRMSPTHSRCDLLFLRPLPCRHKQEPENASQVSTFPGGIVKLVAWAKPTYQRGGVHPCHGNKAVLELSKADNARAACCLGVVRR